MRLLQTQRKKCVLSVRSMDSMSSTNGSQHSGREMNEVVDDGKKGRHPRGSQSCMQRRYMTMLLLLLCLFHLHYSTRIAPATIYYDDEAVVDATMTKPEPSSSMDPFREEKQEPSPLPMVQQLNASINGMMKFHPVKKTKRYPEADFEGLLLKRHDYVYTNRNWFGAPVVVESHKLLFFKIPKVGTSTLTQLLRRMYGYKDWIEQEKQNPKTSGLYYLDHYPPTEANLMLTDPTWTRAVFVRDPKERILSAYLNKACHKHGLYIQKHCCRKKKTLQLGQLLDCDHPMDANQTSMELNCFVSFDTFINEVYPSCDDVHWKPQALRMESKYWKYINFVGHMETIEQDTKRLLQHIDAWGEYGAQGWPNGSIFAGNSTAVHATGAKSHLQQYYTPALEAAVEKFYEADYELQVLNLTRTTLCQDKE